MKFLSTLAILAGAASIAQVLAVPVPEPGPMPDPEPDTSINPPYKVKRQLSNGNTYTRVVYTDPSFINQMLTIHNQYRAHHGAPAMTWNPTLAQKAYNTSVQCVFQHSTVRPYGENVGGGSKQFNNPAYWVYLWWNEIKQYNYASPGFASATGHFTQVVWDSSVQLGCAWVQGCTGPTSPVYPQMVWCEYYPPGNVLPNSNFANHVFPEKASPAAPPVPAYSV